MSPEIITIKIIVLLFSVIIHEVMHGFVALKFGDRTAENAGRLTLNPIPHIDPFGTILLPLLMAISGGPMIGWAKPVPVNPLHFSDLRKGELFVSLAGVLSNFALAITSAILFNIVVASSGFNPQSLVLETLSFVVTINLLLGVFNLFPIPPLDGSKILLSQLPYNLAREYEKIAPFGIFIIIALLYIPIGGVKILSFLLGTIITFFSILLNVPLSLF